MFENLTQKIASILGLNSLIENVYTFEKENPEGTPFVCLTPSGNEGEYNTGTENERVYGFTLRIFAKRKNTSNPDQAEKAMRELVDSIINDLDSNWRLTGLTVPTGYTFAFMLSAPSSWGYAGREDEYRVAQVNIRCKTYFDVTSV